jgi:Putative  PD-(D/E)XK family member, (DUF4420)
LRRLAVADDFPPLAPTGHAFVLGPRRGGGYLARHRDGSAAVVIPLSAAASAASSVYGVLLLRAFPELAFDSGGATGVHAAVTVECRDEGLLPAFAVLATDLLERAGAEPSVAAVRAVIVEWTDLLRPVGALGAEAELGLWGELWLLSSLPDPARALQAWRGPHGAVIDFVGGGVGLECKTARDRHRHVVSLDQVRWGTGLVETFLTSVLVEDDPFAGRTVPDLIAALRAAGVDPVTLEKRLRRAGYRPEHADSCTMRLAVVRSLLFPMAQVPHVRDVDPDVTHVRFQIALDADRHGALDEDSSERVLRRLAGATMENP